jgi:hypothetical protein
MAEALKRHYNEAFFARLMAINRSTATHHQSPFLPGAFHETTLSGKTPDQPIDQRGRKSSHLA